MRTFQFSFDAAQCLNCGVCVDVCPVHCLDMTRPQTHGPESDFARAATPVGSQAWMTVFPVQIARCTGCMVCTMECPTDIVTVEQLDGPVPFAPPQGPMIPESAYDPGHWQGLSAFTRLSHKDRPLGDPWGPAYKWRPVRRIANWRVWRTWQTHADFERAAPAQQSPSAIHEEAACSEGQLVNWGDPPAPDGEIDRRGSEPRYKDIEVWVRHADACLAGLVGRRLGAGLTQAELAARAGISRETLRCGNVVDLE